MFCWAVSSDSPRYNWHKMGRHVTTAEMRKVSWAFTKNPPNSRHSVYQQEENFPSLLLDCLLVGHWIGNLSVHWLSNCKLLDVPSQGMGRGLLLDHMPNIVSFSCWIKKDETNEHVTRTRIPTNWRHTGLSELGCFMGRTTKDWQRLAHKFRRIHPKGVTNVFWWFTYQWKKGRIIIFHFHSVSHSSI